MKEFYSSVIESILTSSQMSESATITYRENGEAKTITVAGLFSSGTYSEDSVSSSAPRRGVRGDFLQVSRTQLSVKGVTEPLIRLKKAHVVVDGKHYGVLEVRGAENELLTLNLRPEADPSQEEED